MSANTQPALPATPAPAHVIRAAVTDACARIAPTWPLDRFIAVNPFWENITTPVEELSPRLSALSGAQLLMPRAWYAQQFQRGVFTHAHLDQVAAESNGQHTRASLLQLMASPERHTPVRQRVTDVADARRNLERQASFKDFVVHHISQFCASYFDQGQAQLGPDRARGLYGAWLASAREDQGPRLLMEFNAFHDLCAQLPDNPADLLESAVRELDIPPQQLQPYFWSLLLDVNGWASWCAYQRWTARLAGSTSAIMEDLLAIRLAWERVLHQGGGPGFAARWQLAMAAWPAVDRACVAAQDGEWLLQRALERGYQDQLCRTLPKGIHTPAPQTPDVQAVFCIDVRSEVFRRALEQQGTTVQTRGFAGFFGLPVDHLPLGAREARPQLPGLLAPRLRVVDSGLEETAGQQRQDRLGQTALWQRFKGTAASGFSSVEATGVLHAALLVRSALGLSAPESVDHAGLTPAQQAQRRPRLAMSLPDGSAPTLTAKADLAAGMLKAMGLTRGLARVVALIGHGSSTTNNPHAAGLDCGACCGQTGEVNARAAAALLNEPAVREALLQRGVTVPATTVFVPGLHNTTTDEVTLFDVDQVPATHAADVAAFVDQLQRAGALARAERAPRLPGAQDLVGRARDWAQVRPEWGLANNAAFIMAPRHHVKHLDLQGRSFLHDYAWQDDKDLSVLELLMTAPMVVTHWINFQYYASTVDNARYGSGNKVLHNVVGGHLGVFEGNGGDLRTGLPMQSLHDGTQWVHTPLRLTVVVEAPRESVDTILGRHAHVRALVENGWLHLLQLDSADGAMHRRDAGGWSRVVGVASA